MEKAEFREALQARTAYAEEVLRKYLPEEGAGPESIREAMNYSLLAGGKRLRPILMHGMYEIFGGRGVGIEPFMAAIEMIHTYSLVHDDLPAMDNDEYRRGRRTTWAVYGDAMGILAGDGLLNFAFETAMKAFDACGSAREYESVASALRVLGFHAGIGGMIGGQVEDIRAEEQTEPLTEEQIRYIHTHKTGALIKASMLAGAILAGVSEEWKEEIGQCALDIGIAFQIQDDILDVIGDSEELGKPVGSDAANGKETYVTLRGLEASQAEVERLSAKAVESLRAMPGDPEFLVALVNELIHRRK